MHSVGLPISPLINLAISFAVLYVFLKIVFGPLLPKGTNVLGALAKVCFSSLKKTLIAAVNVFALAIRMITAPTHAGEHLAHFIERMTDCFVGG